MSKRSYPPEPRLAWAYVREAAAAEAAAPLPELGASVTRRLLGDGGAAEPYRLSPVTLWAHLPPRARPSSFCPVCLDPVTLKLGPLRRHHYAHPPDSTCRAATSEGALHLAAKLRLAEQLAGGGSTLLFRRLCHRAPQDRGAERCLPAPVLTLSFAWNEVAVERSLPSLRADLLLQLGGAPVLAIEVRATHEVDLTKGEKYRSLGVPWLEVSAERVAPDGGTAWVRADPLEVLADSVLHPRHWRCPRHQVLFDAFEEQQRNGVHRLAWRLVHIYRGDGGRSAGEQRTEAVVLSMLEKREGGRVVEGWLQREDRDEPLSRPSGADGREALRRTLHQEFLRWARWTRHQRGAVVDSPMHWSEEAPPVGAQRARDYPQRLRLDPRTREFVGPPGLPSLSWPLPLHELVVPHPLFGHAPTCWTDLPVGDHGALLNAVVGTVWITLGPHEWVDADLQHRIARADFRLHHHDGRRWRQLRRSGFSHTWKMSSDAPPPWDDLLLKVASVAADHVEDLAAHRATLEPLVESVLPSREQGRGSRLRSTRPDRIPHTS